jgi:hypothetical protein
VSISVQSTRDVPLGALNELKQELGSGFELEVDEGQIFLKSAEPPSWVTFLAKPESWLHLLEAAAALYMAEIIKLTAKHSWRYRARAWTTVGGVGNRIKKLADGIVGLRHKTSHSTGIGVGLPVPDEHFPSCLYLEGTSPDDLAVQIALFVHHLPALKSLIAEERLDQGRVLGGISLRLLNEGAMEVTWMDKEPMRSSKRILPLENRAKLS